MHLQSVLDRCHGARHIPVPCPGLSQSGEGDRGLRHGVQATALDEVHGELGECARTIGVLPSLGLDQRVDGDGATQHADQCRCSLVVGGPGQQRGGQPQIPGDVGGVTEVRTWPTRSRASEGRSRAPTARSPLPPLDRPPEADTPCIIAIAEFPRPRPVRKRAVVPDAWSASQDRRASPPRRRTSRPPGRGDRCRRVAGDRGGAERPDPSEHRGSPSGVEESSAQLAWTISAHRRCGRTPAGARPPRPRARARATIPRPARAEPAMRSAVRSRAALRATVLNSGWKRYQRRLSSRGTRNSWPVRVLGGWPPTWSPEPRSRTQRRREAIPGS